jgi:hypothetical protein
MTKSDLDGERLDQQTALALAGRICTRATQQAVASCPTPRSAKSPE